MQTNTNSEIAAYLTAQYEARVIDVAISGGPTGRDEIHAEAWSIELFEATGIVVGPDTVEVPVAFKNDWDAVVTVVEELADS